MSTPSTRPWDGVFYDRGGEGHNVCHSDFGADPTGVASSSDAVDEAIEAFPTSIHANVGGKLIFPPGKYRMTRNLELGARAVLLQGAMGSGWWAASQLVFDDGFGVVIDGVGTTAAILRDLAILSGGPANVVPGIHGVKMLRRGVLENCRVAGFTGDGIHNSAASSAGDNANLYDVFRCMVDSNGGHGIYLANEDANAGGTSRCDVSHNGGWGIYDASFLGNEHHRNHADSNGLGAYRSTGATNQSHWSANYIEGGTPGLAIIDAPGTWVGGPSGAHGVVAGTGLRIIGGSNGDNRIDNARSTPLIGWTAISLGGGFANVGGAWETAQFQVDATATCHLKGEVVGGTTYIGALPQRPIKDQRFMVATANGAAMVEVQAASGQLSIISGNVGSGHWVSLSGISYKTI